MSASIAAVLITVLAAPAVAATGATKPSHQAWSETSPLSVPGAAPDEVYVATAAGAPTATAYLQLPAIPPQPARITLVSASDTLDPAGVSFLGCPLTSALTIDGQIDPAAAPSTDCTTSITATPVAGGFALDLAPFATVWQRLRSAGLALVAKPQGPIDTWRLGFTLAKTIVTSQRPVASPTPSRSTPTTVSSPTPTPHRSVGGGSQPASDPVSVPPVSGPLPGLAAAGPSVPPQAPVVAGAPSVASGAPQAAARPIAAVALPTPSSPAEFVLVLAIVAMLGTALVATGRALSLPLVSGSLALTPATARRLPVLAFWLDEKAARFGNPLPAIAAGLGLTLCGLAVGGAAQHALGQGVIAAIATVGLMPLWRRHRVASLAQGAIAALSGLLVASISHHHGTSPLDLLPIALVTGAIAGVFIEASCRALDRDASRPGLTLARSAIASGTLAVITAAGVAASQVHDIHAAPVRLAGRLLTTRTPVWPLLVAGLVTTWLLAARIRGRVGASLLAGLAAGGAGGFIVVWNDGWSSSEVASRPMALGLLALGAALAGGAGGYCGAAVVAAAAAVIIATTGLPSVAVAAGVLLIGGLVWPRGLNTTGRLSMSAVRDRLDRLAVRDEELANDDAPPAPSTGLIAVPASASSRVQLTAVAGLVLVLAGFVAVGLAWYHSGDRASLFLQMQYLISGGVGGLGLITFGSALLIYSRMPSRQQGRNDESARR